MFKYRMKKKIVKNYKCLLVNSFTNKVKLSCK